eukprot:COSAG06_NODE_41595_length_389_cov_2.541379_1_plen_81_part_01
MAAAGVDGDAVEASSMRNDEQWEIGGATQHEDGTWVYDVMCCVQTWVMDHFLSVTLLHNGLKLRALDLNASRRRHPVGLLR